MNTRISQLFVTGLCIAAVAVGIAYSQTSNDDPPDNDIGGNDNPGGVSSGFNGMVNTACAYDPYTGNAQRVIDDIVVPGAVGAYPLKWTRFYNSRDPDIATGMGVGWRHSYLWSEDHLGGDIVHFPDGRVVDFNEATGISERLPAVGHLLLGDGGQVIFEPVTSNVEGQQHTKYRLKRIIDPHGLATVMDYENVVVDDNGNDIYRLVKITEPAGRYLKLRYFNGTLISRVEAFDAQNNLTQWVDYAYTISYQQPGGPYGILTTATYADGTAAQYTYQKDNSARRGSPGIPLLWLCDDVRYRGAMYQIDYRFVAGDRIRGKLRGEYKPGTGEAVSTIRFPSGRAAQTRVETRGDGPKRTFTYSTAGKLLSYTDFKNSTAIKTQLTYDGAGFQRSVKDAMNQETVYTREPNIGQLTRLTHPGGTAYVELGYSDPNNPYYLTSSRDERGHVTFYDRDGNNRVWQIRYPDGASETFTYNGSGQILTHRRKNGAYEHFAYDSEGRVQRAWNPTATSSYPPSNSEPNTVFHYYPSGHHWAGRVFVVEDPRLNWTRYEYDYNAAAQPCAGRGLVTKITHVDSTYQSLGYDQYGNVIWQENELRQRTTFAYDDYNRLISVAPPAPAGPTTVTYEPTFGTPNPYLHTARAVHLKTDGAGVTVQNKYDENFRVKTTAQLDGTASPPTTSFDYWPDGTLWKVHDPRNYNWVTTHTYDSRNQRETTTDALNRTTRFHYDPVGNLEGIDRPDGKRQDRTYDQMNRVLTEVEPLTDAANKTTTFTYWSSGRVKTVQDNNQQTTRFEYDYADRQRYMFYPDNTFQQWDYDEANNLRGHRTVGGKIQRFQPDNRNRITDTWWDPGNPSEWTHFVYDDASRLTQASNHNGTITRQYDDAGRLLTEEQNVSGLGAKTISYGSDGAGKPTAMGIAGTDYQFAYHYDPLGRLDQLLNVENTPNGPTASLWFQYSYDAASNETQRYCPMNGVAQIYRRDELGRIGSISIQKATEPRYGAPGAVPGEPIPDPVPVDPNIPPVLGLPSILAGLTNLTGTMGAPIPAVGTEISSESYQYDALSRLTDVWRNPSEGLVPRDQFTYDHSGQLNTATYTAWNGSTTRSVNYGQDALGNRSQVNDNSNVQSYSPMPNYRNQYATGPAGPVSHGVEHEIAGYGGLSYGYRNDGRLAGVSGNGSSYGLAYDALGRCVKRTLNGTTIYYTYDGPHPIYEWKADGTRAGWNVYGRGIDEILLRADYQVLSNGQGYFFQQNRLGSVTQLTGFSGETIESYRYDAFGTPTTTNTWGVFNNRFKFTGREYQSAFGIYDYRARAYHPGLGRFLSEDPMGFGAGDTNLFRYCGGDPVNCSDPTGETPIYNPRGGYFTYWMDPGRPTLTGGYAGGPPGHCGVGCQAVSGAPDTRYWYSGAAVGSATMPWTVIAQGWRANGTYPSWSRGTWLVQVAKHGFQGPLNHVAIFIGYVDNNPKTGMIWVVDQFIGKAWGRRQLPAAGFTEVRVSTADEVNHGGPGGGEGAGTLPSANPVGVGETTFWTWQGWAGGWVPRAQPVGPSGQNYGLGTIPSIGGGEAYRTPGYQGGFAMATEVHLPGGGGPYNQYNSAEK